MENELEGLAEPVRRDVAYLDSQMASIASQTNEQALSPCCWAKVRAELIRLARENAELHDREAALWSSVDNAQLRAFIEKHGVPHPLVQRAERAESELAALRKRVGESPQAEVRCRDATWILWPREDANLIAVIGKRVRLVEESV